MGTGARCKAVSCDPCRRRCHCALPHGFCEWTLKICSRMKTHVASWRKKLHNSSKDAIGTAAVASGGEALLPAGDALVAAWAEMADTANAWVRRCCIAPSG